MRERIEADEHVRYVSVDVPGFRHAGGPFAFLLTYHTYDDLSEGDKVRICGGLARDHVGTVVDASVDPPVNRAGRTIYSYRCEAAPAPRVVAVETVRTWSDGSTTHETVWSEE